MSEDQIELEKQCRSCGQMFKPGDRDRSSPLDPAVSEMLCDRCLADEEANDLLS